MAATGPVKEPSRSARRVTIGVAFVVALLVAGTIVAVNAVRPGGDGSAGPVSPAGPALSSSPLPSSPLPSSPPPSSSPSAQVASPFTGLPPAGNRPVLAVKVDNVRLARPQSGLTAADIIYVEPVEGGLSRLMAVFCGRLPERVGPVRSARESDLELLRQFGTPGLAYSGAHKRLVPVIRAAPVVDLSPALAAAGFRRSGARRAPHNLYADPASLLGQARGVSAARDIGFRFGDGPAGGVPMASHAVRYGAATTSFRWSAAQRRWLVSMDGVPATAAEGGQLGAATVVVQRTDIRPSKFKDTLGNATPYIKTVGMGEALVLRDGNAYQARWSRPAANAGTTFTTVAGDQMTFGRGQVWVVFAPIR
jgi:Protein of unknown function (DUF3048) N-terminal domain/Protein of unknown function (DUF3048) C-terminal domain